MKCCVGMMLAGCCLHNATAALVMLCGLCYTVLCCAVYCAVSSDVSFRSICVCACPMLCCAVQMHDMEDVAFVSIFGTVGMLAAMAVVVGKLVAIYLSTPQPAPTELVAAGVSFQVCYANSSWPACKHSNSLPTLQQLATTLQANHSTSLAAKNMACVQWGVFCAGQGVQSAVV